MRKQIYMAVFEPTRMGYSVYFPDLPGCVTTGADLEDAQREAADALGLHLYGMEQDGDPIPNPSETVLMSRDTAPGSLVVPITADITEIP